MDAFSLDSTTNTYATQNSIPADTAEIITGIAGEAAMRYNNTTTNEAQAVQSIFFSVMWEC